MIKLKNFLNQKTLLFISPVLIFIILRYVLGFNGLYGQDSHEYYRYSNAIIDFFKTGNSPGDYFWPIYYPAFGAITGLLIDNLFSLQLISFLSLSGSLFFLYKIMENIFIDKKYFSLYLTITFLFAPYVFRNSAVIMSDMLAVFFVTVSFYFFMQYESKPGLKQLILFSTFSALAILTRYASIVVLVVPIVFIAYHILKRKNFTHIIVLILGHLILVIPMLLISHTKLTENFGHIWIKGWSISNFLMSDFVTSEGSQNNRFSNIINSFSSIFFPTYIVFGLVLVVLSQRNIPKNKYWIISTIIVLLYALFISGIPFQNQRYLLLSFPFVVIAIFPGFDRLMNLLKARKSLIYATIFFMLLIQLFFCIYFFKSAYNRNELEKEIAGFVKSTNHTSIYAFDIDISFTSYDINKTIWNLREKKYDEFEKGSLVIFNEDKFKTQWANHNPMFNWNKLKSNYTLLELKDFRDGWKVYEIR